MQLLIKGGLVAALVAVGFGLASFVQDGQKQDGKKQDAPKADMAMPAPEPLPEHKWLAEGVGTWKAKMKMYMPGAEPMALTGKQVITMQKGGLWQLTEYKSDDGTFIGNGISGYDPHKKKFVTVWVDNWGAAFTSGEGTLDEAKKVLTTELHTVDPTTGMPVELREVLEIKDANNTHFEMLRKGPDGKMTKELEIDYTKG